MHRPGSLLLSLQFFLAALQCSLRLFHRYRDNGQLHYNYVFNPEYLWLRWYQSVIVLQSAFPRFTQSYFNLFRVL
ncbi:uncharacterized protein EV420DRAFT_1492658 [Desarmillaria tabescens]|uniref:Secreted protein n=1 Tax=Armillaria tabescens TaxID=1929756 RepID=A0AA39NP89_ARMTA|nr:uncharacterized protein EV420DRAFT_1492658 [Desarmillaria tabescens]KAK0469129.1 hypothetical protein EV420DRAFT_1492658 [Desarmillaria tabescens]